MVEGLIRDGCVHLSSVDFLVNITLSWFILDQTFLVVVLFSYVGEWILELDRYG